MASDVDKELSEKYCPRFGVLAVELGYVTPDQVKTALSEQIDVVLDELFKRDRPTQKTS